MPTPHFVQRHGSSYRFRARLPVRFASFIDRSDILIPLKTGIRALALKRARVARVALERLVEQIEEARFSRSEAEARVRAWVDRCRDGFERNLVETGVAYFWPDEIADMGETSAKELDALFRATEETSAATLRDDIRRSMMGRGLSAGTPATSAALDAFAEIAPDLDPSSVDGGLMMRTVLRGLATLIDERLAISRGDIAPIPPAREPSPAPSTASETAAAMAPGPEAEAPAQQPFFARWDEFSAWKLQEQTWTKETQSNARSSHLLFKGLLGDKHYSEIKRADVALTRSALFKIPKFHDKDARFRNLPHHEKIAAADKVDALARKRNKTAPLVPRLKLPTVDKHFSNICEYWAWLQTVGDIPSSCASPFSGFIQGKLQGRAARGDRDQWPLDMQEKLFASPVWTGCKSIHRRSQPGKAIFRDALFWAPILGRTLGAREDEICSLLVSHVRLMRDIRYPPGVSGPPSIWYFHFEDSKTPESTRDLPLPDLLHELGFLEHRVLGRDPNEPLFPELIPQGPGGKRAAAFSGRFTEYRRKVGVYQARVDFHSLRATLSTDLQNMEGLNLGWADEITGHISPIRASVRTLYSKGVFLAHLLETLNRVTFPFDHAHLDFHGERGRRASGAKEAIALFTALAEREMAKKVKREVVEEP